MDKLLLLLINVTCLSCIPTSGAKALTHYATISACHSKRTTILALPNVNGLFEFWMSEDNDVNPQRLSITEDGRLFSLSPLTDLASQKLSISIGSMNRMTGEYSEHQVLLRVKGKNAICIRKSRVKREIRDLSIATGVEERTSEVSLDYANAGVLEDSNNQFYLVEGHNTPFTHADLPSGTLIANPSTPLDYETAPSRQYKLTVFVNNSQSADEYRVAVTINLIDVNDETPVFTMEPVPYLAAVDASQQPNSKVNYLITVSDGDASSSLSYSLLEGTSKFRITQDGELYTTDRLSAGLTYIVRVLVTDINAQLNQPQTAEAEIQILAGQRSPQFYQPFYVSTTPENVQGAELDVIIKAKSFQGDALSFTMSESQIFMVVESESRPNEARIRTTSKLDYETDRQSYSLVITATERGTGLSSTVQLTVHLNDANDNSPIFDLTQYVAENIYKEDVAAGTTIITVRALDADPVENDNANGRITYSLQSDSDDPLPFSVETQRTSAGFDGIIKVSGSLDFDRTDGNGYMFRVIATDGGVPPKSSSAYVRVQVQNTNDEAPRFESPRLERIESTKSVNSVVTTVFASDPDGDRVTYAIVASDPLSPPFSIQSSSGSIILNETLTAAKYEDISSFKLNVSATDDGSCCESASPSNVGYVMVVIEIVGRNNAPEFKNCPLYSSIAKAPENTIGAFVVNVTAEDADVGPNGDIKYSVVVNDLDLFRIDERTGEIYTKEAIDREKNNQLTITVKAEDGALSKLSSFCTFTMTMQDLNDNEPTFSLPDSQVVQVDLAVGSPIYTVFALDPDYDINGTSGLTFSVTGNNNFEMDGNVLKNKVKLGTSLSSIQTMTIIVKDHGNLSKSADFTVNIRQTADPPVFTQLPSDLKIYENLSDDEIISRIKAESATGGPVNYYLVPTTTLNAFYMLTDNQQCNDNNELCLAIYQSQNLDADKLRFYQLRVRVTPQVSSSVVAEETINIELLDVNDNIPVFENVDDNGYIIGSVDENTTVINTQVVVLQANDSDITRDFKTKTYSLEPELDHELFRVDPTTGTVRVDKNVRFDRENISEYFIKVKATDGAPSSRPQANGEANSRMQTVQININDINDNPPYFPQEQYTGRVEETAPKGKLVMNVRARDLDIENNFQYIFVSGNDNQAFEITTIGDLLVFDSGRLDYETKKVYNMEVEVSDGRYQARTNVQITLIDMNDNVPEFSQRVYSVQDVTEEDSTISTSNRLPIVRVSATDADVDRPNNIRYGLSGSYSDRFQIDPVSGQVYLVRALDRDSQPQWDVNVLANDEPGSPTNRIGYAIISVFPKDINDNYPVFIEETLTGSIEENRTKGEQVLTIRAEDKDAGNNGSVKFRLVPSSVSPTNYPDSQFYPYFTIDDNGVVTSQATFDRERVDRYTLQVVAYDAGTPTALSATATATIIIDDVNDNPPKFDPDVYERQVSELAGPLSFIVQVNVRDVDTTGAFLYQLDKEALKNFSIDTSGNMYIRDQQRLDFEHFYERNEDPEMIITVTVENGPYTDTATVRITVVDQNDETPLFDPSSVTVTHLENVPTNTLVHTFVATDRDALSTPRNSEIEYLIDRTASSDFNRYFKVDPMNGQVRTQKTLDRETLETHTVKVLAVDNGYPTRRTGTATLIVTLEDINDNGPRLVTPVVHIDENFPVDSYTQPREIKAVDDDDNKVGHGPPFRMSPVNGSESSRDFNFIFHEDWDIPAGLSVANGAGELRTKRVLDREGGQGPEIEFYLELVDKRDMSATRMLTIVIADEDDNPPYPGRRDSLIYNYNGDDTNKVIAVGEYDVVEIGDCYAEDKDDWDKPYKSYEKVGAWPSGFSIDGESGMISADLTVIPSGQYNFQCKVIDNYIADPECSFNCNTAGGTEIQTKACKDSCRVRAEAISDVSATIKSIDEEPVWNGVSIRLKGTAEMFMQPGADGKNPYDIFIERMATSLNTDPGFVDVFSVLDSSEEGFVDVRFTAHGSPYYNASRLIGAVLDDGGLQDAIGMAIAQVPINECLKEVCAGGCTNVLVIGEEPTLVNANGSSLVGVTSVVKAECSCSRDNGTLPQLCTPESCLHGGVCVYNRDSQTTSCNCPPLFDGPRCQQLRHSFTGAGWAQYATLSQCGNGSTSIEFISTQSDGMLLFNGPNADPGTGTDAITDYLLIAISDGKPVVYINYGTGHVKLSIDSVVSNGVWHKLELSTTERLVTLTLDDCEGAQVPDTDTSVVDGTRANCQDSKLTPGENRFLNVATLLELGSRGTGNWWPSEVDSKSRTAYDGCVRSLQHNGELYDLHVGSVGRHSNSQDGCLRVDNVCLDSNGSPYCGNNGVCEANLNGGYSCRCKPGWRGNGCSTATGYMDFTKGSFQVWELLTPCQGSSQCMADSYHTEIQLSFRSRDVDNNGLLFYLKGNSGAEYIKLMIVGGQLQLRYDIGSDSIDILLREQVVTLPVIVTDGALHTVVLTRVGKRFTLEMDGGEGRYSIQHEDIYSHQLFIVDGLFYSGADGPYMTDGTNITASTDLENTCLTDVRFNGKWFPSNDAENAQSSDVRMIRTWNVGEECASDGCSNVNCPGLQQCHDLWRDFDCRCPGGYITLYTEPYCEDINECFPDSPCVFGDCVNLAGGFRCDCEIDPGTGKLYKGDLCNLAPQASKLELATSGVVVLILSLLVVLLIALGVFCYVTRRSNIEKDETLIDSYNDVRETIYNYDEEGMPEEDQDGYDISRLSKPIAGIQPEFDKPLSRAPPSLMDQPPDVGDFITGRLNDADGDPTNCLGDELREYEYEGHGSDAGTLSSLNSGSSEGDQDFDYLNDWGTKFARLADMYSGEDEM